MKIIQLFILLILSALLTAQEYEEIDAFAKSVKMTKDYKDAALTLAEPYSDEVSKVRAIFSWLAYNLEYDFKRKKKLSRKKGGTVTGKNKAEIKAKLLERERAAMNRTLKKKKGVCQDFAWIFEAMLFEIGIESEFVTGSSRTNPQEMGKMPKGLGHAWNVAKINGRWELFDVTWSTDMWDNQNDGFFMIAPEEFLKSHFPKEAEWQLLEEPIDKKTWANQMYWYKGYHGYNIANVKAGTKEVSESDFPRGEMFSIEIELRSNQELYAMKGKGDKRAKLIQVGNVYSVDLKQHKFRGRTTIVIQEGKKFTPLLEFMAK